MKIKSALTILISTLLFGNYAKAQLFIIDNCNPLISSLNNVAQVVKQEYVLVDANGKEFGQDGNEYFGFGYGPGLFINNQLVLSPRTYQPFKNDTTYKSYGSEYTAKSSKTHYKLLTDEAFVEAPTDSLEVNKTYCAYNLGQIESISKWNFEKGANADCLVITYLANDKKITDETTFKMSYLATKVKWQDDNTGKLKNDNLGSSAVFGLLFYQVVGTGNAHLEFGGFVEKVNDEWLCFPYAKEIGLTPAPAEKATEKPNDKGKKKKKKKKNRP